MADDELDRLIEKNSELQRRLFDMEIEKAEGAIKRAVVGEATKRNIDPEAAHKLVDLTQIDLEDPESVKGALDSLVRDKPWLTGRASGPPPSPGTTPHGAILPKGKTSSDQAWLNLLRARGGLNR